MSRFAQLTVACCLTPHSTPLTYYVKEHFRYLRGSFVKVDSALVAPDVGGEDVLEGEVGGLLLLPEEGSPGHGVNIRPVTSLSHVLVPSVEPEKMQNLNMKGISIFRRRTY